MCGICCICCLGGVSSDKPRCYLDMDFIQSNSFIGRRGPDVSKSLRSTLWSRVQALFAGFVLHLRGSMTEQPVNNDQGDILLWNGEIFGGMEVHKDANDTQVLFNQLVRCSSQKEILGVLQSIQGPWAFIYWQAKQERLWFGRDVFGRRSLLWHLPRGDGDDVFALSSVPVAPMELDYVEVPSVGIFCLESSQDTDTQCQVTSVSNPSSPRPSPGVLLDLHLYPWQGATWPGTDCDVSSDTAPAVQHKLGLEHNAFMSVNVHSDVTLRSWMPVVNTEIPEEGSLVEVADGGGGDLICVLREMERKGGLKDLVAQLQNVLQAAVMKRVHNLPRPSCCDGGDPDPVAAAVSQDCTCHRKLCCCHPSGNAGSAHYSVTHSSDQKDCLQVSLEDDFRCLSTASESESVNVCVDPAVKSSSQFSQQDSGARHSPSNDINNPLSAPQCTNSTLTSGPSGDDDNALLSNQAHGSSAAEQALFSGQPTAAGDGNEKLEFVQNCSRQTDAGSPVHSRQTDAGSRQTDVDSPVQSLGVTRTTPPAHVAILFSGGVDSTVLAALADRCLPVEESIDLINVAFEQKTSAPQAKKRDGCQHTNATEGCSSYNVPDRQTGYIALSELNPHRHWNFVEVNVTHAMLQEQRSRHVRHLVYPLNTVLDDSIGCAVWFAAMGKGILGNGANRGHQYTSTPRVILCGMGADEQLAGYSRHRIRFQKDSWVGLINEINMEIHRISARNLGRDDRIITDHGKESRLPFLDEDVVNFLASVPVHHKADLRLPRGVGEKVLLRMLALQLNLPKTAVLPKRAIQFGSRIAKLEQSKEKGAQVCQRLTQEN